jgi:DNA invertase Pin-like site-specific DNA recombinase
MKTLDTQTAPALDGVPRAVPVFAPDLPVASLACAKIQPHHRERLAIPYVRQSSPQQVRNNRESTGRQYALRDYALALGWSSERILVIDDDQAHTAQTRTEDRSGFQRLLAEVTMDHVGIIVGLDMSRLARCDKDWHHLLEVCGIFGTLLADQDGVYDAADPNDRLLLGLKGTISSVELHTMRNRLEKGKLFKAHRGELFITVPIGYVKLPSGQVILDPDEQVRCVVKLIFQKFDELGTASKVFEYLLQHDIRIGVRPQCGPNRGQLEWHRPCRGTIYQMLHHPMYAGTYAYGRCPVDQKRKRSGRSKSGRRWVPMDQWKVLRHDQVPAYITWEQYQQNQQRLKQNRTRWDTPGSLRQGDALLGGILFCARCGTRMNVYYPNYGNNARYDCVYHIHHGLERKCHGVRASVLDALVTQQVLRALEPAAVELSLRASEDLQRERDRLSLLQKQQLERARHEARQAERHYRAVDPENRLVARTLEQQWEQALQKERHLEEEYDRYLREVPAQFTAQERERIRALASDIPALWQAPTTGVADRKEIVRCLIERVVGGVQGNTEHVDVTIHWAGGFVSQHQIRRPVAAYRQLRDYDRLLVRLRALHDKGLTAAQVAEQLNQEGFRPSGPCAAFNKATVRLLLSRWGLSGWRVEQIPLGPDEWWLNDLARVLNVNASLLRKWENRRWVHCRRSSVALGWRILWADTAEIERLKRLRDYGIAHPFAHYPPELTVPKKRPEPTGAAAQS